jgi:hypothetical protein
MTPQIEYLDPAIANEGQSADNWSPGMAWTNAPSSDGEEYQPDIEPPHINDYAAFKKHKHYRQYFRPYRYVPFPAWMYHPTKEAKIVKSAEEVTALGPEWRREPFTRKIDMTGKSLPVKSETQRLAETVASALAAQKQGASAIDPTSIAAVVAAVMAALGPQAPQRAPSEATLGNAAPTLPLEAADEKLERTALLELAEKEGVKVDGRWSNDRIKKELGL